MSDGAMHAPEPDARRAQGAAEPVTAELLAEVLRPYRDDCRYVRTANVEHRPQLPPTSVAAPSVALTADCSIPASCYIDDTGHFNAVELNITYNQLLYTALAVAARDQRLPDLSWDLPAFFEHQLPDVLILDYQATFSRPLDPRAFSARFEIRRSIPKPHKRMLLIETHCAAWCASGGRASANVVVALLGA
ncbi:MAG: FcoT family thioesterase [Planctomycetota bacterium]|nr:FcoT family thioesterase [Planctomycetota bacterium]